jgi:CRISPR-associated protein Csb2
LFERRSPKPSDGDKQRFAAALEREADGALLLRCLLRESGEDMKDGLERPVGTRWVHYAVPREIYNLPPRAPRRTTPIREQVQVVRYVLNTATVHRPVLPPLTEALLIGEKFRAALMSFHGTPSENFSGKDPGGNKLSGHQHAFFLPEDEDEDGFIDHVTVWCPRAFTPREIKVLRSLVRLPQRGGRPDLLVTPTRVARMDECTDLPLLREARRFVSRTPYVPPRHAFRAGGQVREAEAPAAQLRRELALRFPTPITEGQLAMVTIVPRTDLYRIRGGAIERCGHIPLRNARPVRCISFVLHRRIKEARDGRLHHGQTGGAWVIEFPEAVRGPISLGYGAHFGLGQFVPVELKG